MGWAGAALGAELGARRLLRGRSAAWIVAYLALGAAALPRVSRQARPARGSVAGTLAAVGLVMAGYPAGRALVGDRPLSPPRDPLWLELVALALVVAPVEELVWGGLVQPSLGPVPAAVVFALKHPLIDGRPRRLLGLVLFGTGLGYVRRRSRALALALHVAANSGGVLLGHFDGRDRF